MLAGFLPRTLVSEAVQAVPACADLFGSTDIIVGKKLTQDEASNYVQHFLNDDHLRSCKVVKPDSSSVLHISVAGPFEFGGPETRLTLQHPDIFRLRDILRERDVDVRGMLMAPMSKAAEVIPFPPVDVHHMNIGFGAMPHWFAWGISEESQCRQPLGTRCFGREFGNFAFHLSRGDRTLNCDGELLDARSIPLMPGEEKEKLTFWMAFALNESTEAASHTRHLSSVYVWQPFSLETSLAGHNNQLFVPRDEETVFWYSFSMPKGGELLTIWFHSHSTTSVDGRLGWLPDRLIASWDPPTLSPSYLPASPAKFGFANSSTALRARVMAPTQTVCSFANQWELVNGWVVPRWADSDCTSFRFHTGATFVVFIISTPTGHHSHELMEHWQPTIFYEAEDGSTLYSAAFSTQLPGIHDKAMSYYDLLLWSGSGAGGDVQTSPSLHQLLGMMFCHAFAGHYLFQNGRVDSVGGSVQALYHDNSVPFFLAVCLWPLFTLALACCTRSCTVFVAALLIGVGGLVMAFAVALPGYHSEYDTRASAPPSFFIFAAGLIAAGLLCVLLWLRGSPKLVRKAPKSELL
jgi:hypothetical protein